MKNIYISNSLKFEFFLSVSKVFQAPGPTQLMNFPTGFLWSQPLYVTERYFLVQEGTKQMFPGIGVSPGELSWDVHSMVSCPCSRAQVSINRDRKTDM